MQLRIQQEHNPVKKAKLQARQGRAKLDEAIGAYEQGNEEKGEQLLGAYVDSMKGAWQTLDDSGRNAAKQPQGFKDLDISLRESLRLLQDLAHRVSYFQRAPVEKTVKEIEDIRTKVLHALFPAADRAPAKGKHFIAEQGSGEVAPW